MIGDRQRSIACPLNRGSILVMSLWSASILSILLASLAFQAGIQKQLIKAEMNQFEGHWALVSGFNLAARSIASDEEPYNDSIADIWHGEIELSDPWRSKLSIRIEDEESKLNLNLASEKLLTAFFENLVKEEGIRLKEDAKDIVKGMLKWRGGKKNQRVDFLEELLLVEGIEPEDFEKFKPYVTLTSDAVSFPAININTVLPPVLRAIMEVLPGGTFGKKQILEKILSVRKNGEKGPGSFVKEELVPNQFMAKLNLLPDAETVSLVNQLLPYLTTDSNTFHLDIQIKAKTKKAEAIIRQNGDLLPPLILYWNEE